MAGVYVVQYSDNTFALTSYLPLGYQLTVTSNGRDTSGAFIRGTTVGKQSDMCELEVYLTFNCRNVVLWWKRRHPGYSKRFRLSKEY